MTTMKMLYELSFLSKLGTASVSKELMLHIEFAALTGNGDVPGI